MTSAIKHPTSVGLAITALNVIVAFYSNVPVCIIGTGLVGHHKTSQLPKVEWINSLSVVAKPDLDLMQFSLCSVVLLWTITHWFKMSVSPHLAESKHNF